MMFTSPRQRGAALRHALRRARLVRESSSFVRREATKRAVVGKYQLAHQDGAVVFVRHDGLDAWTLEEMFGLKVYAMPAEVRQLMSAIAEPVRVLDLGANIGLASLFLASEIGPCSGVAFEPDSGSADLLERCLAANGLGEDWQVVRACAGNHDGVVNFLQGQSAVSRTVDAGTGGAIQMTVCDVLGELGRADLAKLDIEGSEWEILVDARFAANAPTALVIEYHLEQCPTNDPRGRIAELLGGSGYRLRDVEFPAHANLPEDQGVVWAWRDAT